MKMTVNLDQREVLNNSEGDSSFIIVFNTQIYKNVITLYEYNTRLVFTANLASNKALPVYIGLVLTLYTDQDLLYITPTPQDSRSLRDSQQVFSTSRSFCYNLSEPVSRLSSSLFV